MEQHVLLSVLTEPYCFCMHAISESKLLPNLTLVPPYEKDPVIQTPSATRSAYISGDVVCPIINVSNVATRCHH